MDGKIEQRVCIKFCVKVCKSVIKTLEMLHEAFGEHSLSRTAVFEWLWIWIILVHHTSYNINDLQFSPV
jgi:hypothetical protein